MEALFSSPENSARHSHPSLALLPPAQSLPEEVGHPCTFRSENAARPLCESVPRIFITFTGSLEMPKSSSPATKSENSFWKAEVQLQGPELQLAPKTHACLRRTKPQSTLRPAANSGPSPSGLGFLPIWVLQRDKSARFQVKVKCPGSGGP